MCPKWEGKCPSPGELATGPFNYYCSLFAVLCDVLACLVDTGALKMCMAVDCTYFGFCHPSTVQLIIIIIIINLFV